MITTIASATIASALFLTSALATPVATPAAHYDFTQVLPDVSVMKKPVAVGQKQALIIEPTVAPVSPIVSVPAVTETPVPTMMPTLTPTTVSSTPVANTPVSNFDAVYQDAGSKYGIPWQILYGLHITESGGRDGAIASGRGPQGPMQFMPGTWRAYGVDGNGDGVADINNATDAIHGAANYLAKHGSLDSGLRSYGGNTPKTLELARARGFTQ